MPSSSSDATLVVMYRNKAQEQIVGITGASHYSLLLEKSFTHIILNRLVSTMSEESLLDSQCGFQPDRSIVDMMFTVRQVQERCLEQNVYLYSVLIDLTKAFDELSRNTLWTILRKVAAP